MIFASHQAVQRVSGPNDDKASSHVNVAETDSTGKSNPLDEITGSGIAQDEFGARRLGFLHRAQREEAPFGGLDDSPGTLAEIPLPFGSAVEQRESFQKSVGRRKES